MQQKQEQPQRLRPWQIMCGWVFVGMLSLLLVAPNYFFAPPQTADAAGGTGITPAKVDPTRPDPLQATPIPTPTPTVALATPTPTPQVPTISTGDWPGYLLDNSSFNSDEIKINPTTARQLRLSWTFHAHGGISAQPVVVNDTIYWGSWDGDEHATRLDGKEIWATNLGETTDYDCYPPSVGVASTAAIVPESISGQTMLVDYVGGGNANFYALNAANGKIIWKTYLGFDPGTFIWSSPTVYNGSVYIGVASFGDCPIVQGKLVQLNAATGTVRKIFKVVPDGCGGGTVWSSPTIDRSTGELYISTGNIDDCWTNESYAESLIELHASNLAVVGSWQVPPSEHALDGDFGSTPTLFTATINGVTRPMVGAVNKNGIYYAFVRGAISAGPVWKAQISYSRHCRYCGGPGNVSPAAWDGTTLYIAGAYTIIKGKGCQGGLRALDPATGKFLWQRCFSDARAMAAIAVAPGVVVVGEGTFVTVFDASNGDTLFVFRDTSPGSVFYGAPSIAHGVLYVGNIDGKLYAFECYQSYTHVPGRSW